MVKNISKTISGWGGYPRKKVNIVYPHETEEIFDKIKSRNLIARGNGRAYGDSAISEKNTIDMKYFNHIISFNQQNGHLVVEAGVLLEDIIKTFLPKGWFPYVTPGSKYVTVGGMIAANVHGKNHHKDGSFKNFIEWIDVMDNEGKINRCSKDENFELLEWTLGGMGLTGVIIRASIKLKSIETSWIKQKILTSKNLDQTLDIFEKTMDSTYSVAWLDCSVKGKNIGRSLIMIGEHSLIKDLDLTKKNQPLKLKKEKKRNIPFYLPSWFLNKWFIKIFNTIYYTLGSMVKKQKLVYWDQYFYPLDNLLGWNKIYGKKGFVQYQCVFPLNKSKDGLLKVIKEISKSKTSPFLSVLKRFGKEDSKFSFPMEGLTIALDFPVNDETFKLLDRLDKITIDYGGRIYLAKDSRIKKDIFQQIDHRTINYINFRKKKNYRSFFSSSQSTRLGL